jgi:hypothetical protein
MGEIPKLRTAKFYPADIRLAIRQSSNRTQTL